MAKVAKKTTVKETAASAAALPTATDEIFKLKVDSETQKFFIDDESNDWGQFDSFLLRPLEMYTKIVAYNEEFKVKAESNLFQNKKEAIDTWGNAATDKPGRICGRVIWNNLLEDATDEEKAANKAKAKFYVLIFGIATVEGHDPILVDFRIGGVKFMDAVNILKRLKDDKGEYCKGEIKFVAKPSDEYDWPDITLSADFSRNLPMEGLEPLFETVEAFVQEHNAQIVKKAEDFKTYAANKPKPKTTFKRKY